jgi:DNA-binding Lrp family transcriptional regulator
MDKTDRRVLNFINKALPIEERPFKIVAESAGITEKEAIERVRILKDSRIIRRIGAVVNPAGIGWKSTLCAADIPLERLEEFAEFVASYIEVTHNYLREGHPNCWFTIIAPSRERLDEIIGDIEKAFEATIIDLPASRVFKIRVALDL